MMHSLHVFEDCTIAREIYEFRDARSRNGQMYDWEILEKKEAGERTLGFVKQSKGQGKAKKQNKNEKQGGYGHERQTLATMNSKFGRGGGRGLAMRHGMKETGPPPLGRGMGALQPRMQSLGAGPVGLRGAAMSERAMAKGRLGGRSDSGAVARPSCASQDEKFQLQQFEMAAVRPFAMAIRLTPELLSDLKRAESEGAACLMKFGFTATGHVLKIGDEEFKFNSAREDGGLCDIFEEQRRGEDGNGVLKEAGSVWRKLSVLRTLNASEKDRVKKRSVEAQQQQKSRKAIILDPTHSQNLTQNSSIAGDALGRRPPIKTKVQPPRKKCKPNSPVRSPIPAPAPVPVQKPVVSTASAIASAKAAKAASVASPELPPCGKASLPPPLLNGKPVAEEGATPSMSSVQMDSTPSPATTTPDTVGGAKPGAVVGPTELRNCLITLLTENPKGMTLKAVEKSLGDSMPHVKPEKKTIEKAIRAIASFHAPGKYILKEGVTFAKPSPNSGSSPENAAADSPPLVDSPALLDMNVDSSIHDEIPGGARHNESGLLGDKISSLNPSGTGKAPSVVQKGKENAVSRAIRKASESYLKSQPQSLPDGVRPASAAYAEKVEGNVKKVDIEVETEQISVDGVESGEIGIIEVGGRPDMNGDTAVEDLNGGAESVPNSPKEKANSGGSESSSSSGSSDSDSESSDSGDSRSGTSGSGSDSDSDGSSSDSDDENMDEDVEIVSDDEDGDVPHQKPKANDKKKASHQSKEAKRAKLKPPEKLLTRESEEIDIGGDEGAGHPGVDPEERATVVVENLDTDDLEVDVVSVGGGDSPQNTGSVSPIVSEQQMEERKIAVTNAPAAVEDNRGVSQKSSAIGNSSSLSKEELSETGETGAHKETSIGKRPELGKPKASAVKGRVNNRIIANNNSPKSRSRTGVKESPVHNNNTNNRPPARDSLAQSASPSRPETGTQSLLGSPALKKDATVISPRLANETSAKRRNVNPEVRKSFSMEAKTESEELVDKLVEAPIRSRPRPGKSAEPNRMAKYVDAPQSLGVDATPESGVRGSRDSEPGPGLSGRETEAEVLPSASRPLRDGPWRQNSDGPGLLGKPGRPQGRETEANLPTSRQLKNTMRRTNNELDAARRNESMNDPDSWWKPTRDLDGTKLGNDSDNRFRKESTRLEGPKGSLPNRQNEKKVRESPDRESGEWRESTPGLEQLDMKGKSRSVEAAAVSGLVLNKSQNRELIKPSPGKAAGDFSKRPSPIKPVADFRKPSPGIAAGELRKPSPVKAVGDLRNPSPAKVAGDLRKPSPGTSNAQKLAQVAQKEPLRFDPVVARDSNRAVPGLGKLVSSSQVEERSEGGPNRNSRASNETFERPMESRGVKRQLDDGNSEPPRVYKKSSVASVAPTSSFNRGVSDRSAERKPVSPNFVHKPQNSEADRGASLEGPTSLAGPSGKASGGENGRKQRLLGKSQKSSAKDAMEPPRGRDWKAKISAGLLGPGGDKKRENLQSGPRLSNGKRLKSSSSPEEVSGKAYFAKYEKDAPDLRGPIRSPEEAEAYKKEYQTKYHVYTRLWTDIDKNRGHFHLFKREMLQATSHPDKLQQINTKVRREYHAIRKEFKRMQKTFDILHDELQTIKQHLRNFAGKAGQG